MLEASDALLIEEASKKGMEFVEFERMRRGSPPLYPLRLSVTALRLRPALEMYRLLTGFPETNPNALRIIW